MKITWKKLAILIGVLIVGLVLLDVRGRAAASDNSDLVAPETQEYIGRKSPTSDFTLSVTPLVQGVCVPEDADFNVEVGQVMGFTDPVTLSALDNPAGTTTNFSTNPVAPPGTSTLTIGNTGVAATGSYSIDIIGIAPTSTHTATVTLNVYDTIPGVPTLLSPSNDTTDVSLPPTFQWSVVGETASYFIEISTASDFSNIVDSATVGTNSYIAGPGVSNNTEYYWRVTASNACGDGTVSATFHFTTQSLLCRAPALGIVDNTIVTDTFSVVGNGIVQDLNVSINANHTWVGDLTFTLTHQDTGTSVTMIDRPGVPFSAVGCSNNNLDVLLDDEGTDGPVEDQCALDPALFGNPTPNNPLSAFDGEALSGTWLMSVMDSQTDDSGILNEWCLLPSIDVMPEPLIDVAPASLNSTQPANSVETKTLTISNSGTANLFWNIDGFVADGGFESGTPSSIWTEASTNFGTPICDVSGCGIGEGTGPHTGVWWTWFGGIAAYEEGSVSQSVTISSGSATLSFWLEIPQMCDSDADYLEVLMDSNQIFLVDGTSAACGISGYALQTIDVSAYADGGSHTLEFHAETFATNGAGTDFYVDDVALIASGPSSVCSAPANIPWISLDPANGTVPMDSSSDVSISFDSIGLNAGVYSDTLCVTSNDTNHPLIGVPLEMTVEGNTINIPLVFK